VRIINDVQCQSKNPPWCFLTIFLQRLGIFSPNCTHILNVPISSTLDYKFFIWLSAILTKLCHIKRDHPVHTTFSKCPPSAETYAGIFWHFPQTVGNFWSKFYTPIRQHVPIYARLQIFIQLSPTVTKLGHIKCDHPACVSTDNGRFEHIMVVALNMA